MMSREGRNVLGHRRGIRTIKHTERDCPVAKRTNEGEYLIGTLEWRRAAKIDDDAVG